MRIAIAGFMQETNSFVPFTTTVQTFEEQYYHRGDELLTAFGSARLEIPAAGWTRIYRARLFGKVTQAELDKLATGITIDGVKYGPIVADLERSKGMYSWATVSLKEGKNREVKRVMERLGLKVARLIRTAYGPFQLGQLAESNVALYESMLPSEARQS